MSWRMVSGYENGRFHVSDRGRASLHVSGWAVEPPKAVVQVLHGMADYGSRYARLAEALAAAGYTTYAHDHRGHGKSISDTSPPGHFADHDSWDRVVADAHGVNREIARRHPGLPIIVLGHSMGSFVLQQMLFEHPGDMVAAALSGSSGKPPAIARRARSSRASSGRASAGGTRATSSRASASATTTRLRADAHRLRLALAGTPTRSTNTSPILCSASRCRPRCGSTC